MYRYVTIRANLGDVGDHQASEMADQILSFAFNTGESARIVDEGIEREDSSSADALDAATGEGRR